MYLNPRTIKITLESGLSTRGKVTIMLKIKKFSKKLEIPCIKKA